MNRNEKIEAIKILQEKKRRSDFDKSFILPCFKKMHESKVDTKIIKGGRTGGKSVYVMAKIVKDAVHTTNTESLIVCLSSGHKINTKELIKAKLEQYNQTYKITSDVSGAYNVELSNGNVISLISIKAGSLDEMQNKTKTWFPKGGNKLINFVTEEWDGIISYYKDLPMAINSMSSFLRHFTKDTTSYYIYNPPKNKKHLVHEWADFTKHKEGVLVHTQTIYDLPKEYQSEKDLQEAEALKKVNEKAWRHMYMGEPVGEDGLAFPTFTNEKGCEFVEMPKGESVVSYDIFIDRGLQDATSMCLYQRTDKGNAYLTDTYYHSCRETGDQLDDSDYAKRFDGWVKILKTKYRGMIISSIWIDGLALVRAIQKIGYRVYDLDKRKRKNQPVSYRMLNNLILVGRFKILKTPENMITINQLMNAEVVYKKYQNEEAEVIARPDNSNTIEEHQIHTLDCSLYMAYNMRNKLGV